MTNQLFSAKYHTKHTFDFCIWSCEVSNTLENPLVPSIEVIFVENDGCPEDTLLK